MRRTAAIAILYAAFTGRVVGAADAQGGDRPGRALFEQAEAKFNVGRFEEALVDYQAAYDVEPLPAFLFNIGQCYRNLGNYERAQFFFRRYTVLDPRSPDRAVAERLIAEMDRRAAERAAAPERDQLSPSPIVAREGAGAPASDRATTAGPALLMAAPARASAAPAPPIYRRTWFWVAVSAVVVASGVAAGFAFRNDEPRSSLRPIDTR